MPRFALSLLSVLLLVMSAACGGGEPTADNGTEPTAAEPASEPRSGGQAVVGSSTDMGGVNEVVASTSLITTEVIRRMFLPLVEEQPDFKTIEPRLAESWEFSDDRKKLTFHLRDDVVWSDGEPVTSADVVFSYRAWTDPDVAWESAYALEAVEGVEAVDEHTVRFDFSRTYSTQLLDTAAGAVILPEHVWGQKPFDEWRNAGDWFRENLVVNGPFDLESWTPQQEVVLKRNPLYYEEGLPYLDRLVLRIVPNQANQLTQLLTGDLDLVIQLSPDDVERVKDAEDTRIIPFWTRGYISLGLNQRRAPFGQVEVRRAITYGIDRQTLVDSIWGEYGRVIASPIPPNIWAYNEEVEPLPYDPDEARRLLREAGWTDSDGDGVRDKDGQRLTIDLMTNTGNRQREDAMVLIQDQLGRIGVEVTPQAMEFNTMIQRVMGGDFDAVITGWQIPTTFDFRYAFASEEIDGGSNVIAYSNPEMDQLLADIRSAPTLEEAKPLIDRLQVMLQRDQPYTFLWQSQRLVGVRDRLQGVQPNHLFNLFNARYWWVEDSAN